MAVETDEAELENLRASVFGNEGIIRPENNYDTIASIKRAASEFLNIEKKLGSSVGRSINKIVTAYDRGGKMLAASVNESIQGVLEMPARVKKSISGTIANLCFPKISLPKPALFSPKLGAASAEINNFFASAKDGYLSAELKFRKAVLLVMNSVGSAYESGGEELVRAVKISAVGIFGLSEDTSLIVENSFYEFGRGMRDGARGGRKLALALSGSAKNSLFAYNSWLTEKASGINDVIMRFPDGMAETLGLIDDSTGETIISPRIIGFWKDFGVFGARQVAVWRCRMDISLCPSPVVPEVAVETVERTNAEKIKDILASLLREMVVRAAESVTTTP